MPAWMVPSYLLIGSFLAALLSFFIGLTRVRKQFPAVQKGTIAFFHPFADGGGGGERVLWCAVRAIQTIAPEAKVVIYAREGTTPAALIKDAAARFNVQIDRPVQVVPLKLSSRLLPERYPRFTLVGQAYGSLQVAWEALQQQVPEIFIDTSGWAFTYPLARLAGARVACYVHYPTISTDMLGRVWSRQASYNNRADISGSLVKSLVKVVYYQVVALLYGIAGAFAHVTMVNSSWTMRHIRQLWWSWREPVLVYPPVDTAELSELPLDRRLKHLYLVSVAQFRPEKNHRLQLEAFALARQRSAPSGAVSQAVKVARLKMVGSCRGPEDEERLRQLQQLAQDLGISEFVDWFINVPFSELKMLLGGAVGGLHSMLDEHFGISVVEYMAAGVIPIAHDSGGPRSDIVLPDSSGGEPQRTGFLASTVEEYADAITQVLGMDQRDRLQIGAAAKARAAMFSGERFEQSFVDAIFDILPR